MFKSDLQIRMENAMKFRKKPVVIEAIQLTEKSIRQVYSWIYGEPDTKSRIATEKWQDYCAIVKSDGLVIRTLEDGNQWQAKHVASLGDWIIRGVAGEFYPCKPDIFEATYEMVED